MYNATGSTNQIDQHHSPSDSETLGRSNMRDPTGLAGIDELAEMVRVEQLSVSYWQMFLQSHKVRLFSELETVVYYSPQPHYKYFFRFSVIFS